MRRLFVGFGAALLTAAPVPAEAFGLRTHLWMAQTIHADVADDCRVTLREGRNFALEAATCSAIRDHKGEFLAGAIGPDAFPDMAMGQTVIHPGLEHKRGWATADWLQHLLTKAQTPPEIAFSTGFLLHAAGDIFAHSYVNNYAGDVFVLADERLVEQRHTLLEKYIDARLPAFPMGQSGSAMLSVPASFAADQLIFDPEAGKQNAKQSTAFHLVALREARDFAGRRRLPAEQAESWAQQQFNEAVRLFWAADAAAQEDPANGAKQSALARARKKYNRAYHELRSAKEVAAFTREWERSLTELGRHYIRASLLTARAIIDGPAPVAQPGQDGSIPLPADDNPLRHYRSWFACFSPILRGEPVAIGEARCEVMTALGTESSFAQLRNRSLLTPGAASLYNAYQAWRRQISRDIARAVLDLGAGRGWVTMALIRGLTSTDPVTVEALDQAYRQSVSNKDLLVFGAREGEPGVSALINEDLGLTGGRRTLDPEGFKALDYAIVLGKLALLDRTGVREVAAAYGGDPARVRMNGNAGRYSILIDTARSIDGSHQWQEFAWPFARSTAEPQPETAAERRFGYGPANPEPRPGFSLHADRQLRGTVFTELFPRPFEGAILRHPRYARGAYDYGACPGDPLRPPAPDNAGNKCDYDN
jgi:hypothetical protein